MNGELVRFRSGNFDNGFTHHSSVRRVSRLCDSRSRDRFLIEQLVANSERRSIEAFAFGNKLLSIGSEHARRELIFHFSVRQDLVFRILLLRQCEFIAGDVDGSSQFLVHGSCPQKIGQGINLARSIAMSERTRGLRTRPIGASQASCHQWRANRRVRRQNRFANSSRIHRRHVRIATRAGHSLMRCLVVGHD